MTNEQYYWYVRRPLILRQYVGACQEQVLSPDSFLAAYALSPDSSKKTGDVFSIVFDSSMNGKTVDLKTSTED